jgi:hypothetical protein
VKEASSKAGPHVQRKNIFQSFWEYLPGREALERYRTALNVSHNERSNSRRLPSTPLGVFNSDDRVFRNLLGGITDLRVLSDWVFSILRFQGTVVLCQTSLSELIQRLSPSQDT